MRIAVIADTHDHFPEEVLPLLEDVDEIWHLGDVCETKTLNSLSGLHHPVQVVRGNNDTYADWPITMELEREGVLFYLVHIPPRDFSGKGVVLHGHTHIPRDETVNGVRYLNPGSISKPKRDMSASFAYLEVNNGEIVKWEIVNV